MTLEKLKSPFLIDGKKFIDDRGSLSFVNELLLNEFKRFYIIENHTAGFVRAWHGHMKEAKAFVPIEGAFLVGAVPLSNLDQPSKEVTISRQVLDASSPQGFLIPKGFANGLMSLTERAKLLVLSSSSLEESQSDDYRFPFDYWNIWNIERR
jgi:dTDP-4-dehydrorhamnose 3,5-epimerase-like enzyme